MKYYLLNLIIITLLSACGQKGDLFLQEPELTPPNPSTDTKIDNKLIDSEQ